MTITLLTDGALGGLQPGYPTRAAAIAALPGMATGTTFTVGSLAFIKDDGTSIPDMPGAAPANPFQADVDHFRDGTTTAQNDAAMAAAVAWLNAADYRTLTATGSFNLSSPLPAMTGFSKTVNFEGARLNMATGANNGKFMLAGTTGSSLINARIRIGDINIADTCGADDFAFDFVNCTQVDLMVTRATNLASVFRCGALTTKAQQVTVDILGCTTNRGGPAESNILIQHGSNIDYCVKINGGVASNGNANGAMSRIKAVDGGAVDTVQIRSPNMQMFSVSTGSPDGKPFGLVVDSSDGAVTNVWFEGAANYDHTTVAAIKFVDAVGSTSAMNVRCSQMAKVRCSIDAGKVLVMDKKSALGSAIWAGFDVTGLHCSADGGEIPIVITGAGYSGCRINDCGILGKATTPKRTAAISIASNGWSITNNYIGRNTTAASGFAAGILVDSPDVTDLTIFGNTVDADIETEIILPTFTLPSANRNIQRIRTQGIKSFNSVGDAAGFTVQHPGAQVHVKDLAAPAILTSDGSNFYDMAGAIKFHPASIAGAHVWDFTDSRHLWVTTAGVDATPASGQIGLVDDMRGRVAPMVQSNGTRRPLRTVASPNYALFDGVDDSLAATFAQAQSFTIGMSFRATNVASAGPYLLGSSTTWHVRATTAGLIQTTFGTILNSGNGEILDEVDYRLILTINGASSAVYKNNVSVASGNAGTAVISEINIGNRQNTGGLPMAGRIYRACVIPGVLDATNRGRLDTWLTP